MKRNIVLKDLAEIRFGINGKGMKGLPLSFVQVKDYPDGRTLIESDVFSIDSEMIKERDFLKNNDLLFAGKGSKSFSVVWNGEIKNAVASSTFYIIQVVKDVILPQYLAWFLNSEIAQNYFNNNMYGVTIKNISKKVLEELSVIVPDISEQIKIVKINELWMEEKRLMGLLLDKKERLYQKLLITNINS